MKLKILYTIVTLILLATCVGAAEMLSYYNPFTQQPDYYTTDATSVNLTGQNLTVSSIIATDFISGPQNWTDNQNYPAACPGTNADRTYLTAVNDTNTCTGMAGLNGTNIADIYLFNSGDTATGDYNFDANTFFIDSGSDRVGIGTTTPVETLEVNGNIKADNINISEGFINGDVTMLNNLVVKGSSYFEGDVNITDIGQMFVNNTIEVQEIDGVTKIMLNASGDSYFNPDTGSVGIGTTTPSVLLEVNGAAQVGTLDTGQGANELHYMNQDVGTTNATTFVTVNTGQGAYELYAMNQDVEKTDSVTFVTVDTGQGAYELYAMNQDVEKTDSVTFGTIGIGTESPNQKLDVNGNVTILEDGSVGDSGVIKFISGRALFGFNGVNGNALIQGAGGKGIEFNVNSGIFGNNTVMEIESDGNVGIGTADVDRKLHLHAPGSNDDLYIRMNLNDTVDNKYWDIGMMGSATGTNDARLDFGYGGNVRVTFENAGNVGIGTTDPTSKLHVAGHINVSSNNITNVDCIQFQSGGQMCTI